MPLERVWPDVPRLPPDRILGVILANPSHNRVKPLGEWLVRSIEGRVDTALSERGHSVPIGLVRCHPLDNRKGIINSKVRILVPGNVLALQRRQYRLVPKAEDRAAVCRITFSDLFAIGTPARANDRRLFLQMSQKLNGIFGQHVETGLSAHVFSWVQRGVMRPQTAHFIMAHSAAGQNPNGLMAQTYLGTPSPNPWDLSHSARMLPKGGLRRPPFRLLGRRSGRIPALPYPPPR
jgi:hypothetical protein